MFPTVENFNITQKQTYKNELGNMQLSQNSISNLILKSMNYLKFINR